MTVGTPRCRDCRQPILWAQTVPGMQRIALDPNPSEDGVYAADLDAVPIITAVRRRRGDEPIHFHGLLYTAHIETCPARLSAGDQAPGSPQALP
ncbi:MAG: hypothetical protein JWM93_3983 [Frankiales bacterium]|nr:hypothetical protein [Frankiales bacterium]